MKLLLVFCLSSFGSSLFASIPQPPCPAPERYSLDPREALEVLPKPRAYTQGLVWKDGLLYESQGLYGRSNFSVYNPANATTRLIHRLPSFLFGEGLAFLDGRFFQLTWRARLAFVYTQEQAESGEALPTSQLDFLRYTGQGWGLAAYGNRLAKSDGSSFISLLHPKDFSAERVFQARTDNGAFAGLNELETIEGKIYANLYTDNAMVSINPNSGCVERYIDLNLLREFSLPDCDKCGSMPTDTIANGIAYNPGENKLYLTGKLWPFVFVFNWRSAEPEGF